MPERKPRWDRVNIAGRTCTTTFRRGNLVLAKPVRTSTQYRTDLIWTLHYVEQVDPDTWRATWILMPAQLRTAAKKREAACQTQARYPSSTL